MKSLLNSALALLCASLITANHARADVHIYMTGNVLNFEFLADGNNYFTFSNQPWGTLLSWSDTGAAQSISPSHITTTNLLDKDGNDIGATFKQYINTPLLNGSTYCGLYGYPAYSGTLTVKSGIVSFDLSTYTNYLTQFSVPTSNDTSLAYGSYTGTKQALVVGAPAAVPEPTMASLLSLGLGAYLLRRRKSA